MGFFVKKAKNSSNKKKSTFNNVKGNINVETLHKLKCKACPLDTEDNNTPRMESVGVDNPLVYVLSDTPRYIDDSNGEPLTSKTGVFLKEKLLETYGSLTDNSFNMNERTLDEYAKDYFKFGYIAQCRTPKDRDLSFTEVECCRPRVISEIEKAKPKVILGTGASVLKWLIDEKDISVWRGRKIPVQIGNHKCWFMPITHPLFILHKKEQQEREGKTFKLEEERLVEFDIRELITFALQEQEKPEILELDMIKGDYVYAGDSEENTDVGLVNDLLEYYKGKTVAFDIETSGEKSRTKFRSLKPYGQNAKILSISFSDGVVHSSIALEHSQNKWKGYELDKIYELLHDFLFNSKGKKIAHNLSFELEWLGYYLGYDTFHSIEWGDTLAGAYILDQRPKGLGLEVQCHNYFGISMKQYEKVDRANLDTEDLTKVLKYNVVDSIYTYYLEKEQQKEIKKNNLEQVYYEQVRRIPTLVIAQIKGILVDQEKVAEFVEDIQNKQDKIIDEINNLDEIKQYSKMYGYFNPGSEQQVAQYYRDYLGRDEGQKSNNKYSTDETVLKEIDDEVARKVLEYRGVTKLKGTYIEPMLGFKKNTWPDGLIHTNFNHSFTLTRRLSSRNPNFQNQPSREHPWIRDQFIAEKGNLILTADYSQAEARAVAVLANCIGFKEKLWQDHDIHLVWSERLVELYSQIMKRYLSIKELRGDMKNGFTFPLIYSSSPKSIAKNLNIPDRIAYKMAEEFFDELPEIKTWQNEVRNQYYTDGYVTSLTGFIMHAPIEYTKLTNYPVQSTASDFTLYGMNKASEYAEKYDIDYLHPINNCHDEIAFSVPKEKADFVIETFSKMMTYDLVQEFNLDVPIEIEVSAGKSFYDAKKPENEICKIKSTDFGHKKGSLNAILP